MKKFSSLLLVLTLVLTLAACSNKKDTSSEPDTSTPLQTESTNKTEAIESDTTDEGSNASETSSNNIPTNTKTNTTQTDESSSDTETPSNSAPTSTETSKPTTSTPTTNTNKPTTNSNTTSTHTHTYSAATCTEPQKCSCGVTDGVALGHKYSGYKCNACNGLNPNEKYIKQTSNALGIDGKGIYGRAGEDYGFVIKDECKNYVQSIDNIIAMLNGKKCTVHLALNTTEVEKLVSDYVPSMKEYYNSRGWNFDANDEKRFKEIAQEYYLPCSAIAGVNFPVGIFDEQKENIVNFDTLPCEFIITVQYTLVDGTKIQQNWNYDAIYSFYAIGTIPARCFSHTI